MRKGYEMTVPSRRGSTYGKGIPGKPACCPIAAAAVAAGWPGPRGRAKVWSQVVDFLAALGVVPTREESSYANPHITRRVARRYDGRGYSRHTREEVLNYVVGEGL